MTQPQELTPTSNELAIALQRLGWHESGGVPDVLTSWASGNNEVVVPLDPGRGDFTVLLDRALRTVENLHGATVWRVLQRVIQSTRNNFDISRFIRETATSEGIISWTDGRDLFAAAEQSLLAAARSARSPRKYHGRAGSYLASSVLQSTFMGQTEVGSFAVTMLTHPDELFVPRKSDESRRGPEQPGQLISISGRQVLSTLEAALAGTRQVLDSYRTRPQIGTFSDLVSSGVSAELLRALTTITQNARQSSVVLDFAQDGRAARRSEFEFVADEAPVLERASRRLMEDPEPQDVTIVGGVTMLTRPRPGENGLARIRVESGANIKNVRVQIDAEHYDQIIDAHRDGLELEIAGRLERDGNYYWMYGTTITPVEAIDDADTQRDPEQSILDFDD